MNANRLLGIAVILFSIVFVVSAVSVADADNTQDMHSTVLYAYADDTGTHFSIEGVSVEPEGITADGTSGLIIKTSESSEYKISLRINGDKTKDSVYSIKIADTSSSKERKENPGLGTAVFVHITSNRYVDIQTSDSADIEFENGYDLPAGVQAGKDTKAKYSEITGFGKLTVDGRYSDVNLAKYKDGWWSFDTEKREPAYGAVYFESIVTAEFNLKNNDGASYSEGCGVLGGGNADEHASMVSFIGITNLKISISAPMSGELKDWYSGICADDITFRMIKKASLSITGGSGEWDNDIGNTSWNDSFAGIYGISSVMFSRCDSFSVNVANTDGRPAVGVMISPDGTILKIGTANLSISLNAGTFSNHSTGLLVAQGRIDAVGGDVVYSTGRISIDGTIFGNVEYFSQSMEKKTEGGQTYYDIVYYPKKELKSYVNLIEGAMMTISPGTMSSFTSYKDADGPATEIAIGALVALAFVGLVAAVSRKK